MPVGLINTLRALKMRWKLFQKKKAKKAIAEEAAESHEVAKEATLYVFSLIAILYVIDPLYSTIAGLVAAAALVDVLVWS